MQRFFRKAERKFSSPQEKQNRENIRLLLHGLQLIFVALAMYELARGDFRKGLFTLTFAMLVERMVSQLHQHILNDKETANYIADHYSGITKLPETLITSSKQSLGDFKEEVRTVTSIRRI